MIWTLESVILRTQGPVGDRLRAKTEAGRELGREE